MNIIHTQIEDEEDSKGNEKKIKIQLDGRVLIL